MKNVKWMGMTKNPGYLYIHKKLPLRSLKFVIPAEGLIKVLKNCYIS